jgi:hypothetical protein
MRHAKSALACCTAIALAYLAYPYLTLYRLNAALHTGDAQTLQQLVNWSSVREGIKEDICDGLASNPGDTARKGDLPGFGAGFMRGIATNAVDERVTPQGLVAAVRRPATATGAPKIHVTWAFFDSPTQFSVDVKGLGKQAPVRMQLELKDATWQVTRVWLPPELLGRTEARI